MTRSSSILADFPFPRLDPVPESTAIRAALIGYGRWGANLGRNAARVSGCRLVAIADRAHPRLDEARRTHPGTTGVFAWQDLLLDPDIDAVLIATPSGTHFELAYAALAAGKHVFVEKPMAATAGEARELIALAGGSGRVLMVDHTYVFSPAVRAIASALAAGTIGRATRYESSRFNAGNICSDAPVHWDLAVHDLAILGYLFADRPGEVEATRLDGGPAGTTGGVRITVAYPGAFIARIESNWTAPAKVRHVRIIGSEGQIDFDDLEPERKLRIGARGRRDSAPPLDDAEPLSVAISHFVGCIQGRERPLADGRAGLDVLRVLEAADRSLARGGRAIGIEPDRTTP